MIDTLYDQKVMPLPLLMYYIAVVGFTSILLFNLSWLIQHNSYLECLLLMLILLLTTCSRFILDMQTVHYVLVVPVVFSYSSYYY